MGLHPASSQRAALRSVPWCPPPPPASHRRSLRVLELEPVAGETGAISGAQPLRHEAVDAELAAMPTRKEPSSMLIGWVVMVGDGMTSLTSAHSLGYGSG